jgi:hypothetical protein
MAHDTRHDNTFWGGYTSFWSDSCLYCGTRIHVYIRGMLAGTAHVVQTLASTQLPTAELPKSQAHSRLKHFCLIPNRYQTGKLRCSPTAGVAQLRSHPGKRPYASTTQSMARSRSQSLVALLLLISWAVAKGKCCF